MNLDKFKLDIKSFYLFPDKYLKKKNFLIKLNNALIDINNYLITQLSTTQDIIFIQYLKKIKIKKYQSVNYNNFFLEQSNLYKNNELIENIKNLIVKFILIRKKLNSNYKKSELTGKPLYSTTLAVASPPLPSSLSKTPQPLPKTPLPLPKTPLLLPKTPLLLPKTLPHQQPPKIVPPPRPKTTPSPQPPKTVPQPQSHPQPVAPGPETAPAAPVAQPLPKTPPPLSPPPLPPPPLPPPPLPPPLSAPVPPPAPVLSPLLLPSPSHPLPKTQPLLHPPVAPTVTLPNLTGGIENYGNSCFVNAALQFIYHISTVREYLINNFTLDQNLDHLQVLNARQSALGVSKCLNPHLNRQILQSLSVIFIEKSKFNPIDMKKLKINNNVPIIDILYSVSKTIDKTFTFYQQQDSSQFLISMLEAFECFANNEQIDNIVNSYRLFEHLNSKYTMPKVIMLTINQQRSHIQKLITEQQPNIYYIDNNNQYIIIIIARMNYDQINMKTNKLTTNIIPDKEIVFDTCKFQIDGCILHTGEASGGHYIFIKYINDNLISVYDDGQNLLVNIDENDRQYINRNGYVYLYKRISYKSTEQINEFNNKIDTYIRKNADEHKNKYLKYKQKYLQLKI